MKNYLLLFILLIAILLASCVYFNTFYNAKRYYAEALEAKSQNKGKLTSNIREKLDISIGKCAYIIQEYPKSKWVDNAILLMGQCFYEQGNYIKALRKFQEYEKYYGSYDLYPVAKLYLAKTHLEMKEYDAAMKQFSAIFTNPKFIEVREDAYFTLVYYYIGKKNFKDAKATVLTLLDSGLKKKSHLKAMFLYAEIEYFSEEYKSAERAFRNLLAEKPPKRIRLDAMYYIGKILLSTHNYADALVVFQTLEKTEVHYNKLPQIKMNIAICEAYLGNQEKAFEIFETLIKENAGKSIVSEINYYWADIYFSLLNDYEKAEEKFKEISMKNLSGELMNETTKKLKITQEFISYHQKQSTSQINQLVEFQFQIAEYYNFDLNLPDSALSMYDKILGRYPQILSEIDSIKNLISINYPVKDSSYVTDSLSIADPAFVINDSLGTQLTIEDSINLQISDTTIVEDSIIISSDTTFILKDSLLVTNSTLIDSTIQTIPAKETLLLKIENLMNARKQFEKEIIPKALFMKLWTYQKKKFDTENAAEVLEFLENDYPNSQYTIAGRKIINNEPFNLISAKEHFAQEYLQKALDYYFDSITLEQSYSYLDTILTSFDSTDVYPQALYLKSYLLLKEQNDTTSARPYLEELFTDYPEHELKINAESFFDGHTFLTYKTEKTPAVPDSLNGFLPDSTVTDTLESQNLQVIQDSLKSEEPDSLENAEI
ncbi:MAG TPA: tetratricopeptide repeat protein [Candidatus Cloacimonetes bacterium]|nr:tetratricopeptide repeat protein [Candidatus Cloacimonadota bacterium]HEX38173.1 tetratricopeptide repeat protein [Candidatus Cloacimonadota bacterium]